MFSQASRKVSNHLISSTSPLTRPTPLCTIAVAPFCHHYIDQQNYSGRGAVYYPIFCDRTVFAASYWLNVCHRQPSSATPLRHHPAYSPLQQLADLSPHCYPFRSDTIHLRPSAYANTAGRPVAALCGRMITLVTITHRHLSIISTDSSTSP